MAERPKKTMEQLISELANNDSSQVSQVAEFIPSAANKRPVEQYHNNEQYHTSPAQSSKWKAKKKNRNEPEYRAINGKKVLFKESFLEDPWRSLSRNR